MKGRSCNLLVEDDKDGHVTYVAEGLSTPLEQVSKTLGCASLEESLPGWLQPADLVALAAQQKPAGTTRANWLTIFFFAIGFIHLKAYKSSVPGEKYWYTSMVLGDGNKKGKSIKIPLPAPPNVSDTDTSSWVRLGTDGQLMKHAYVGSHNLVAPDF